MTKMRQWSILTAVAVLVVFAAGWFLLVKPQQTKSSSLRSQAATQQQANQLIQTQIDALNAEQKNLPEQQHALQKFNTQVPSDAAEPTIIRQLSAAAAGAGVNLVSMTPGVAADVTAAVTTTPVVAASPAPTASASGTSTTPAAGATSLVPTATPGGLLEQLPISIGVTGTFPNMETFFQSLEKLPRAMLIQSWSMCPDVTGNAAAATTSGASASCTLPATPSTASLPTGTLGATLNTLVFYAPPAGTVPATTLGAPTTTATTPATTPSPATTPTAATTAAAN
jgi:Tfp pilus assembly protein PilO